MSHLRSLLITLFVIFASPAFAAKACYNQAQSQAEHLLRLHSELMVVAVTCRQSSTGQDLGAAYGEFTKKNIRVLHDAEQTMLTYYKTNGSGAPLDRLDRLRTLLANEFGQKSADMGAPAFCGMYRDKVTQFAASSPADVENEVERMQIAERTYVNPCNVKDGVVTTKGN